MAKILTAKKKKQIENTLIEVLWEQNDLKTREAIKQRFLEIMGFPFRDMSNDHMIDAGFAEFQGYDPGTGRMVDITIGPGTSEEGPKYMEWKSDLLKSLEETRRLKLEAVKAGEFERACSYRDREKDILDMIASEK
jgi:hypothetical protein